MTQIFCYVEGPSDKAAMEALLRPLIEEKARSGTAIEFFEAPDGDRKKSLLLKVPIKAVNILRNRSDAVVVVIPDLYPRNRGFPHETPEELSAGLIKALHDELKRKNVSDAGGLLARFRFFCFKHDLEALVLASREALVRRLGAFSLIPRWVEPVEDQDHERPPKTIVTELFREHGQVYKSAVDAPQILGATDYRAVAQRCPQCFQPFVDFLESV